MVKFKLEIVSLTKSFVDRNTHKKLVVLKDLSFKVKEREFVCVIGPSGCGKTTLLRIIAGLEKADEGEVLVDSQPIKEPSPEIGMVFQEYALFPWRTIIKNVEFGLEYQGISLEKRGEIAKKYLQIVDLDGWEDKYPFELSGGMKQRAAIARALVNDPKILLMDEPFGSVDAQSRNLLQDQLLRIWEETGKTILFVGHHIDEAIYLADRIIVLTTLPAQIKRVQNIELPRPRNRTSMEFQEIRAKILEEIVEEVMKTWV